MSRGAFGNPWFRDWSEPTQGEEGNCSTINFPTTGTRVTYAHDPNLDDGIVCVSESDGVVTFTRNMNYEWWPSPKPKITITVRRKELHECRQINTNNDTE